MRPLRLPTNTPAPAASMRSMLRSGVRSRRDPGNGTVVVAASALALMAGVLLAIGHVGAELVDRERARNAADAAALAAVIAGPDEARAIAERNGATMIELQIVGDTATAVVRCGRQRAVARATNRP